MRGGYWLDRNFIVIFTSDGKIHKLYKLIYDKDLSVKAVKHKEYTDKQPESWFETIDGIRYLKKISFHIKNGLV